jgi:hypothetical protein
LSTARNHNLYVKPSHRILGVATAVLFATAPFALAQSSGTATPPTNFVAANLALDLPDSPSSRISSSSSSISSSSNASDTPDTPDAPTPADPQAGPSAPPPNARTKHSAHLEMTIAPNEIASPMPVGDKIVGGLKDSVSLFSAVGWVFSAGWEQATNGSPNYGTNSTAFGKRLGASAGRNVSETVFTDAIFAPIFHEDPRYYIMGRGNNFFKRAIYAGTRTIITRTDGGHSTPNFALLAGNAAGAALTVTYYPDKNTTFSEVAQTFGGSIGGSALGFVVTEFISDALQYAHLKKRD